MNEMDTRTGEVLISERVFDAPPEAVWRAWTDPERLMRWWGGAVAGSQVKNGRVQSGRDGNALCLAALPGGKAPLRWQARTLRGDGVE